jgi:hypothetical protein
MSVAVVEKKEKRDAIEVDASVVARGDCVCIDAVVSSC